MEGYTQINIRLTLEQKAEILAKAKARGMSLSDYVRHCALGIEIQAVEPVDVKADPVDGFSTALPQRQMTEGELITQLKGQGMTTPVARREAKKRLGL